MLFRSPAADGALLLPPLARPGRWRVAWSGGGAELSALPIDPRQADLAAAGSGELAAAPAGRADVERRRDPLAALLPLLAAAIAALAAWAAFAREERR